MTLIDAPTGNPPQPAPNAQIDKKVNRTRRKSPYRDAQFRPLFRALEAFGDARRSGETSVTYATPSHPSYPHLHLKTSSLTLKLPAAPETLTLEEEIRDARFWRSYSVPLNHLPRNRVPAPWRDLSDLSCLEWLHHTMRASGGSCGFTLNLSDDIAAKAGAQASSAGWLAKRIARELKAATGRHVPFFFAFEVSRAGKLHVHGELQIETDEHEAVRKALRRAGGEWDTTRQHQAKTKPKPSVVWTNYCAKDWTSMRAHRFNHSRPINGDWFFATNEARSSAKEIYEERRKQVLELMQTLPARKFSQH
ncbi:hypothetical protein PZ895_00455 [Mesorhizobium sp. YIM 152430]|uniref:hypothetical protein n=1 Tax=Mesorhizobium sp. YIM 152430 TaxID=3031761 RepID=UPI0023DC9700|nr:hypothetical protein [Mesorhizobium sp. YIM 152430]MDF1598247.1 hypothetical protein [Mesorhizobium sp. YIM 152430]